MLWELTFQGPSTHRKGVQGGEADKYTLNQQWGHTGNPSDTQPLISFQSTLHVIPGGFRAPGWDPPSWLPTSNLWARLYPEEAVLGLRLGVHEL